MAKIETDLLKIHSTNTKKGISEQEQFINILRHSKSKSEARKKLGMRYDRMKLYAEQLEINIDEILGLDLHSQMRDQLINALRSSKTRTVTAKKLGMAVKTLKKRCTELKVDIDEYLGLDVSPEVMRNQVINALSNRLWISGINCNATAIFVNHHLRLRSFHA